MERTINPEQVLFALCQVASGQHRGVALTLIHKYMDEEVVANRERAMFPTIPDDPLTDAEELGLVSTDDPSGEGEGEDQT